MRFILKNKLISTYEPAGVALGKPEDRHREPQGMLARSTFVFMSGA